VTRGATSQNAWALYVVRFKQLSRLFDLLLRRILGGPLHIENLFFGPYEILRRTVARKTPFHLKRGCLIHHRHLIDLPVTSRTTDSLRDMYAVIEISEIR
jgi:hypothetical protein